VVKATVGRSVNKPHRGTSIAVRNSSRDGSTSTRPPENTIVGTERYPPVARRTNSRASSSSLMSISRYGTASPSGNARR
jgi:hypothetical protein